MAHQYFQTIDVQLEAWRGRSPTMRPCRSGYRRWRATQFRDMPADLTERMENFVRNLIRLARAVRSNIVPVEFSTADGRRFRMDRGCIKIAERAGVICRLQEDDEQRIGTIRLKWRVRRKR